MSSQKLSCSQQAQGSQMDASTNGSQAVTLKVDLVQDSDGENEKVAKKPKKEHHFDDICDYFDEMETYINVSFLLFPIVSSYIPLLIVFSISSLHSRKVRHALSFRASSVASKFPVLRLRQQIF